MGSNQIRLKKKKIPTIFIKQNKETSKVEREWEGSVYDLRYEHRDRERIYFKVKIDKEIPLESKYDHHKKGWYIKEPSGSKSLLDYLL